MTSKLNWRSVAFVSIALLCFIPTVSATLALFSGIALALTLGNPFPGKISAWTRHLLAVSIIGLGAGMDLMVIGQVGAHGVLYTAAGIAITLGFGMFLGKILNAGKNTSILISVGTAICGGSAIAAVSPVIKAKPNELSVALAMVFALNALALLWFPAIGHAVQLDQMQFGLWSALAIHDTSSVVGASMQYGAKALEIGTTVKLARALWIIPVTLLFSLVVEREEGRQNENVAPRRPWFILGFLITAAIVTWVPPLRDAGHFVELASRRLLVVTLFLIGSGLTRKTLATVGLRPLTQGIILWVSIGTLTLGAIKFGLIGV